MLFLFICHRKFKISGGITLMQSRDSNWQKKTISILTVERKFIEGKFFYPKRECFLENLINWDVLKSQKIIIMPT